MDVRIQTDQKSYLNGENVRVDVEVRNTTGRAMDMPELEGEASPQLYFVVSGPSFRKPYRFHWSGSEPKPHEQGELVSLQPGASLKGTLLLPAKLPLTAPGRHELYATYEWKGAMAESNRISVDVAGVGAPVFRVIGRTPLTSEVGIQAMFVSGSSLYVATFREKRPDLGETAFNGLTEVATLDKGAADFFAPWCATAERGFIGPRFGWRTGNTITVAGFHKAPQKFELPFTPRLYGPSLMSANGDIDLLVTSKDGLRLALIRFPNVAYDEPPAPARLMWERPAGEPVTDFTSSINPAGERVAAMRQGSAVRLVRLGDAGPEFSEPVVIEGTPVTAVLPALTLSVSGTVRASVLTASTGKTNDVRLTEITWRTGAAPEVRSDAPIALSSPVRTGTVAYTMSAVEEPRREWLFVLGSHRLLHSHSGGKAYVAKRETATPPQLLVMSQLTYDLEFRDQPMLYPID